MDKRHVNTRNHDLLGLGISKIEYIVNHITLFIFDDTPMLGDAKIMLWAEPLSTTAAYPFCSEICFTAS